METGVDFNALGNCFSDMCKEMLDENCSNCENVLECILYPKCCIAAGVKWTPEDALGWELTMYLVEGVEDIDELSEDSDLHINYDFTGLTPEDTEILWVALQNCRFTQPKYKENIEKLLKMIWEGVSGEELDEAPLVHEVENFSELASTLEEEEDD